MNIITRPKSQSTMVGEQPHHHEGATDTRSTKMKRTLRRGIFFGLMAAAVLTFVTAGGVAAQAQSRGYWAKDGCYYQHNGYGWQRVECQYYDRSVGTRVARNGNGTFYLHNGRWYDYRNYMAALTNAVNASLQGLVNASQDAQNQATINQFMRSRGNTSNGGYRPDLQGAYDAQLRIQEMNRVWTRPTYRYPQ